MKRLVLICALGCGGPVISDSNNCKDYIDCCTKVSGASHCADSTFGAMGTCWNTT